MQNQTHETNSKKKISFNIDEFDIDSYDFKPVTKGLGFHGEKDMTKSIKVSEVKLKASPSKIRGSSSSRIPGHLNDSPSINPLGSNMMTGIDAIYNRDKVEKNESLVKKEKKEKKNFQIPSYSELAIAYILDLLLVVLVTMVLFNAFYVIVFKQVDVVASFRFMSSSWDFAAVFFGLVYISYFTILGPIDSLGKKIFGISQRDEKDLYQRVDIRQSFVNSLIGLCSIPLFFVPIVFDFHNKISGIRLIKN